MLLRITMQREGRRRPEALIDILRELSRRDSEAVCSRWWVVSDLNVYAYGAAAEGWDALEALFPGRSGDVTSDDYRIISGERLLERSAVVHQFESGLFMRIADIGREIWLSAEMLAAKSNCAGFRATNVDLEIRTDDFGPYEVISEDSELLHYLRTTFSSSEHAE